jgi:hypothetical protein
VQLWVEQAKKLEASAPTRVKVLEKLVTTAKKEKARMLTYADVC